jgi:hypothetical protein
MNFTFISKTIDITCINIRHMDTLPFHAHVIKSLAKLLHLYVIFTTIGVSFFEFINKPWLQTFKCFEPYCN